MGYARRALTGFSLETMLKLATAFLALVKIFVLARVLNPEAFGLFSLSTIALGVTESFTQTGVNITILRSNKSVNYFLDSAWVIAIIRGVVIGILMLILGFALSKYFNNLDLLFLIALLSLVPVIKGFINPSIISLRKNLKFFADSLYRFSLLLVEVGLAILLGLLTKSVYALIFAMLAAAIFEVLISFLFFKNKPKFYYLKTRGSEILANAKYLSFSALFNYLNENLDNFLIGKINGVANLGLYDRAYAFSHKINYEFAKSAHHSTFPIFSKLKNKKRRLRKAFARSTLWLMLALVCFSLPVLIWPKFFVSLLLGEKWLAVIKFIRWLVLAGLLQSLVAMLHSLFLAQKKFKIINWHLSLSVLSLVILILFLGNKYGLSGAAAAVFLSRLLTLPILLYSYAKD